MSKSLASVQKSKQFQNLIDAGLKLVSTERQLANGTLAFKGKFGRGRNAITPSYVITASGAVISNEFVARKVSNYKQGLTAVAEILEKRLAA